MTTLVAEVVGGRRNAGSGVVVAVVVVVWDTTVEGSAMVGEGVDIGERLVAEKGGVVGADKLGVPQGSGVDGGVVVGGPSSLLFLIRRSLGPSSLGEMSCFLFRFFFSSLVDVRGEVGGSSVGVGVWIGSASVGPSVET